MLMRKVFASIVLVLCASIETWAGEPYFCCKQGTVLQYQRAKAESGKIEYNHTMTIVSVNKTDNGSRDISYTSDFKKENGRQMYGGIVSLSAKVNANGDTELNVATSLLAVLTNYLSSDKVSVEGGESVLPSSLKADMTLPEVHAKAKASIIKYTVDVIERSVLRTEKITTPAGSFDCVVVQEHKVEKGAGRNRNTVSQTWYARGIGYVRHDTYEAEDMTLLTSEVLQSITSPATE